MEVGTQEGGVEERGERTTQRRACHTHLDAEILK